MEPPNHQMAPMRVLLKIQKADPPKLDKPSIWSKEFNDFIAYCLTKDPAQRPNASDLLNHPFIKNFESDRKSILDLISEYKAEVVEEVVTEDPEDEICDVSFHLSSSSQLSHISISIFALFCLIIDENW
jgi:STE20-like kinase